MLKSTRRLRCRSILPLALVVAILSTSPLGSFAQNEKDYNPPSPKQEFRGVWVATVKGLDYPARPSAWPTAQKEEWKNLLKQYKSLGLNAVIFQARPAGDAFYPTEYAPWSEYLAGRQGLPPNPEYDVLEFLIQETHQEGMEFHAWLNPYRATMGLDTAALSPQHLFNRHRDWLVRYGQRFYLNPGLPQVREHVRDVVAELVQRYDVDAIHFDDYFYPYPITNEAFPDSSTFLQYGRNFPDINAWRRNNVDELIRMVSLAIKEAKPHVYFGISPFGVWRNKQDDPAGSDTRAGAPSYDAVHADVLSWLRQGWIDYVLPQLYWHIGFPPADNAILQRWWSLNTSGRQLYIGFAAYKVGNDSQEQWYDPGELPRQIRLARRNRRISGGAFFRSGSVLADPLNLKDTLRAYYRYPALLPCREELGLNPAVAAEKLKVGNKKGDARIIWRPNKESGPTPPYYYVLYRFTGAGPGDLDDPRNILHITSFGGKEKKFRFTDTRLEEGKAYTYQVTAVNRAHCESKPGQAVTVTRSGSRVKPYKRPSGKRSWLAFWKR
ncbi:MAG: family 10 glycosylhydrolase [Lewinellaceae bacterium]|nr:family 10 glycosylhydrolase [Lewinellaceae bacterium]